MDLPWLSSVILYFSRRSKMKKAKYTVEARSGRSQVAVQRPARASPTSGDCRKRSANFFFQTLRPTASDCDGTQCMFTIFLKDKGPIDEKLVSHTMC